MRFHRIEVPIRVQELVVVEDTKRPDDDVDRLSNGHPALSQFPIILGRREGHISADQVRIHEIAQQCAGSAVIRIVGEALQKLRKNQIPDEDAAGSEKLLKMIRLPGVNAVEVIHPDRGVNEDHGTSVISSHHIEIARPLEPPPGLADSLLPLDTNQKAQ